MNHFDSSADDFEDVPSPFKTASKTPPRSNMFSRPVGTVPSEAPIVTETTSARRKPLRTVEEMDFAPPRRKQITAPPVDYLDDEEDEEEEIEEEVVEKRPARVRNTAKAKAKSQMTLAPKIGWGLAVVLLLRLIFMERGVLQYAQMSGTISEHETELARVKKENADIRTEVRRIEFDKGYQKQLAKEHLGVIAADEFLILFAGEASETENSSDRLL